MLLRKHIPWKYLFGIIKWELIFITVYAIIVTFLFYQFEKTHLEIPLAVPMIMGTVISLLLGFRSNQAYDRWWEARIVWGAIVNDSRSLTRQLLTFLSGPEKEEIKYFIEKFVNRQSAWNYALGQGLRGKNPLEGIDRLLTPEEYEYVSKYKNVHNAILELHGRNLRYAFERGWLNEFQQINIDNTLSKFSDSMGKCERIKNTVFPTTYSLYIHIAVQLFLLLLPFALISNFGVLEVPLVVAIAAMFMVIENMAIQLQDPFENKPTDTPMTSIAQNIERDTHQMIDEHSKFDHVFPDPKPLPKMGRHIYYQM